MSDKEIVKKDSMHHYSNVLFDAILESVEPGLNDHINRPINWNEYWDQRKYNLEDAVFIEKNVTLIADKKNKLCGYPVLIEGDVICNDNNLGKSIGTISIKLEVSYNLDKDVTTINAST